MIQWFNQCAATPLGAAGVIVVVGLLMDPLTVFNEKPATVCELLFDTKRY